MSCPFRELRLRPVAASLLAMMLTCRIVSAQQPEADVAGPAVSDQGLGFALTSGASWSDNIGRVASDEQGGTIGRAGVQLGFNQRSRRLDTNVDVNAEYEHYFDSEFDDGVVGGVNATLNLAIVPDRFVWFFQENFGQITSDPFAADTPDNRENINYFTTGPDFIVSLGSATSLRLSGRYSDTQYEISQTDGQQSGGVLSLARRLSSTSTLSLNVEGNRFEFDDQIANTDYDRYQAYARYEIQGARTSLSVDAGYTTLDIAEQTSDGVLARISLSRRMSPASTLTLSAGSQFSDSGNLFRDGQNAGGVSPITSNIVGTSDPFESRSGTLAYDFNRNRTSFGVSVQYGKEQYETQVALDRKVTTWGGYLSRQLSRVLDIRLFAQLEQEEFESTNFEDDELRAGAYLNWALGRMLSLRLQYDRFDRDSTSIATEYTENQASLFLVWSPVRRP